MSDKPKTDLVFLDTETTGLNPDLHEVWEFAWVVNDETPVRSHVVPHSELTADPDALAMNGYWERSGGHVCPEPGDNWDLELRRVLEGNTLVCSNPTFDRMFLRKRWGVEPWHHRSVDISSFAMPILGHDRPMGLKVISDELREAGYNIAEPTHAAWIDVVVLRESYKALNDIQKRMRAAYDSNFTPERIIGSD